MAIEARRGMLGPIRTIALACCIFLVAARPPLTSEGVVVNFARSPVALSTVWSTASFDYDFVSGGVGPIYFNDCLDYLVRTKRPIKRIEFAFALSGPDGKLHGPALPVNVIYRNDAKVKEGDKLSSCKIYGYEAGAKGLPLIAWVSAVHFVDGTVLRAPGANNLRFIISEDLSKQ